MADINIKAKITTDTGEAGKGVEQFENKIKSAGNAAKGSGQDFGKLKDTVGSLGPVGEQATAKMGMLNQAFNVLKANPIIAVFAAIAAVVIAIVQRMSEMEAVSDALGKAFGTLSGIINAFVSKVLTPLIDGFVWLIENTTSGLIKVLDALGVTSEETANRMGALVDTLDDLEESEKNSAIATAEANRKLQEAREIAADANLPIKQRVAALKEAARIEREESEKVVAINRAKAAALLEQFALENGAKQKTIDLLRQGTIESLKAARAELLTQQNVNKDKIFEIDKYIIAAENESASLSKIAKKTQAQISGIEKEEQRKREQQQKEHQERVKKQEEAHQKELDFIRKTYAEYEKARFAGQMKNAEDKTKKEEEDRKKAKEQEAADFAEMERFANETATVQMAKSIKLVEDNIALAELEKKAKIDSYKAVGDAFNALADVVGRQTAAGKALSTAQALINTYLGVTQVLANKTVIPEPFGTIQKIASIATILASGFSAVRNINKVQVPGGGGGQSPSTTAVSASAPLTPSTGTTTLDAQTIQNIGNAASGGVGRSYVLETDIRNNSERSARLQRAARLA